MENTYLDRNGIIPYKEKIAKSKKVLTIMSVLTVFVLIGWLSGDSEGGTTVISILFIIITIALSVQYRKNNQMLIEAGRLDAYFVNHPSGIIPFSEIAQVMQKSDTDVDKFINTLFNLFILKDCYIDNNGPSGKQIVLVKRYQNANAGPRFVEVVCRSCGARQTIRSGFTSRCQFCGFELTPRQN